MRKQTLQVVHMDVVRACSVPFPNISLLRMLVLLRRHASCRRSRSLSPWGITRLWKPSVGAEDHAQQSRRTHPTRARLNRFLAILREHCLLGARKHDTDRCRRLSLVVDQHAQPYGEQTGSAGQLGLSTLIAMRKLRGRNGLRSRCISRGVIGKQPTGPTVHPQHDW